MEQKNPNLEIAEVFYRLNIGAPVDLDLVTRAFELILTSPQVKARDAQLGSFLMGLMVKGPTSQEIVALIRTALNIDGLTRYKPNLPHNEKLVGVAGSGKKGWKTFNISTPACFVASAAGAFVAKTGSAATSSIGGSTDLIKTVGVNLLETNAMIAVLQQTGFGIFSIEDTIPKFDGVYGGKAFGPTPLSFAFPAIISPVACETLLYGLSHPDLKLALEVFSMLSYKNVMVVTSTSDDIHYVDELSTLSSNRFGRIEKGVTGPIEEFSPTTLTQTSCSGPDDLQPGLSLIENAQLSVQVLSGKAIGPRGQTVALNAAAILVLASKAADLCQGYALAIDTIRSETGLQKLRQFIDATGGSQKALATIMGESK